MIRGAVARGRAILAVENAANRAWIEGGRLLPDARVVLMPGAGVELERFRPSPEPTGPIVVGVIGRLVWSKGVDVAVEAVRMLRARGLDIELHIGGTPDTENPRAVDESSLAAWAASPGVRLAGRVDDVAGFWAGAHIGCVPTRGGEGLPRVLLEAAACGRPLAATRTPGCVDFIEDGVTGLFAPPGDSGELAAILEVLARDADLRRRMGAAARAKVEAGYSVDHAAAAASEAWRRALS
jgi:glycosyltransferase involved in cell wall biosynthesis